MDHLRLIESFGASLADFLVPKNARFVVASSAGVDSMALTHLCLSMIPHERVTVAHYDHGTRADSPLDLDLLRNYLRVFPECRLISKARASSTDSSEAEMRQDRYQFLEQARRESKSDYIVLAHHRDDQIETLFWRLIRGTGMSGLQGMQPKTGWLLRPLLRVSKKDLVSYATHFNIPFREDSSNHSNQYFRNRLRKTLMPVLSDLAVDHGGIDAVSQRLLGLMDDIRESNQMTQHRIEKWLQTHAITTAYWLAWSHLEWNQLKSIEQTQLLAYFYLKQGIETPSRDRVRALGESISERTPHWEGPGKIKGSYSCGYHFLQTHIQRQRSEEEQHHFNWNQNEAHCPSLNLRLRIPAEYHETHELGFFRPGDRCRSKKMSDTLLENRVPSLERSLIPVLKNLKTQEVIWHYVGGASASVAITERGFPFTFESLP